VSRNIWQPWSSCVLQFFALFSSSSFFLILSLSLSLRRFWYERSPWCEYEMSQQKFGFFLHRTYLTKHNCNLEYLRLNGWLGQFVKKQVGTFPDIGTYHCQSHSEWPDWANFRQLVGCLLRAVLRKLHKYIKYFGYFFHSTSYVLILTKHGLGYILGDFFTYVVTLVSLLQLLR
jgi:hypothetical protein